MTETTHPRLERDARPEDCECIADAPIPCWRCYRAGFETANDDAPTSEELAA